MAGKLFVMVWEEADTATALTARYRAEADGTRRMRVGLRGQVRRRWGRGGVRIRQRGQRKRG